MKFGQRFQLMNSLKLLQDYKHKDLDQQEASEFGVKIWISFVFFNNLADIIMNTYGLLSEALEQMEIFIRSYRQYQH